MQWQNLILLIALIVAACSSQNNTAQSPLVGNPQPCSYIHASDIDTRYGYVTILKDIKDIRKGGVLGTGSMRPSISDTSTLFYLKGIDWNSLCIGDIILFNNTEEGCNPQRAAHRIISKNADDGGIYYMTKGDNARYADSCKVRADEIQLLVVGIIY